MTSLFARLGAVVLAVIGVVFYVTSSLALRIADRMTADVNSDASHAFTYFFFGVVLTLGGFVAAMFMIYSEKLWVNLSAALPMIIMCMPIVGVLVQETAR